MKVGEVGDMMAHISVEKLAAAKGAMMDVVLDKK